MICIFYNTHTVCLYISAIVCLYSGSCVGKWQSPPFLSWFKISDVSIRDSHDNRGDYMHVTEPNFISLITAGLVFAVFTA